MCWNAWFKPEFSPDISVRQSSGRCLIGRKIRRGFNSAVPRYHFVYSSIFEIDVFVSACPESLYSFPLRAISGTPNRISINNHPSSDGCYLYHPTINTHNCLKGRKDRHHERSIYPPKHPLTHEARQSDRYRSTFSISVNIERRDILRRPVQTNRLRNHRLQKKEECP